MKPLLLLLLLCPALAFGSLSSQELNRMADIIKRVENSSRFPYGIILPSRRQLSEAEARRICINTIRNNHARWVKAGKPGDWIVYLGRQYCPPSVDPAGHRHWVRNVRRFLK